jgi:hypothetical protein
MGRGEKERERNEGRQRHLTRKQRKTLFTETVRYILLAETENYSTERRDCHAWKKDSEM